jgi:putative transposase
MAKLSKEDYEYRRTENSVSSINYHFVFVPKRRRPVLIKDVAARLQEIIFDLVTEHGWKLIALEVQPDLTFLLMRRPMNPQQISLDGLKVGRRIT